MSLEGSVISYSFFLGYDENIVSCEITGQHINRGAGLGIVCTDFVVTVLI